MKKLERMLVFALLPLAAHAGIIAYSDSGTFSSSTPSDAFGFSGPGKTWAFSFLAASNPTVLESDVSGFNFAFSSFSYSLNGSPVAITPTFIRFFPATNAGGWEVCFSGTNNSTCTEGFANEGPQMYTGTTSAPTLLPGAFTSTGAHASVGSTDFPFDEPNNTMLAVATPEPSTLLMLAVGLLALGGRRPHWRN